MTSCEFSLDKREWGGRRNDGGTLTVHNMHFQVSVSIKGKGCVDGLWRRHPPMSDRHVRFIMKLVDHSPWLEPSSRPLKNTDNWFFCPLSNERWDVTTAPANERTDDNHTDHSADDPNVPEPCVTRWWTFHRYDNCIAWYRLCVGKLLKPKSETKRYLAIKLRTIMSEMRCGNDHGHERWWCVEAI